jgi:hypothetical protein
MAATRTTIDAILKEFYEGVMRKQLNSEIKLFDKLKASDKMFSGRRVVFPVHLGRNVGVGARGESAILPAAGSQTPVECRITAKYNYGRLDITGQAIESGKHAFLEGLALEVEGLKDDFAFELGRQSYGGGDGRLAIMDTGAASASSLKLFNKYAAPGEPGARYIKNSQVIELGTVASPSAITVGSACTVTNISVAVNSGTLYDTLTVNSASGDATTASFIFNHGAGGQGVEMMGLRGLVDDLTQTSCWGSAYYSASSLNNVDRGTYAKWNANVDQNSGVERVVDSQLMQKAFSKVKKESGKDINMIIGEYDVVDQFLDSVSGDRRYASKNYDAGVSSLSYNGVPLVQDLLAPYNELFLLNSDAIKQYTMKDFSFADKDGSILKNVAGYDRWEAFFLYYGDIASEQPKATMVIRDILDR